jgi:hypothetical protein
VKPAERFRNIVNLEQFQLDTSPLRVCDLALPETPDQMVLRMLVQAPYSRGWQIPPELEWLREVLLKAQEYQHNVIGIRHPFTYVTVRKGPVATSTDDLWHVDGFSTRYAHLPEANYLFAAGSNPTQYLDQRFTFPEDFDPLIHNIHTFFQGRADLGCVRELDLGALYFMDPYVVHRRPPGTFGVPRTFARISFTPIEIPDVNNTKNPLIPTSHYVTDGIKEFRNSLLDYKGSP